ncbi:alcohol dehydrogenase [Dentipellis sp. KUC8613]|nr:alcohol dehydrogenase [Dentipellis sp. KUC8613]
MSPSTYTRILLNERPKTTFDDNSFRSETVSYDLKAGPSQVVLKNEWLSLDPAMRGWVNDGRSYLPPVPLNAVMRGGTVATVIEAGPGSKFAVGDTVTTFAAGWTEYAVVDDKDLQKLQVPPGAQLLDFLGPLGATGLTAYFGLLDVGKIKAGQTLVVSGAAGAVGSIVCQIGKKHGAKVYAIAGSDDKCQWLEKDLGVEKALNYKSPTFHKDFIDTIGYLDVFFDNVGGEILNFALTRLNQNARIVLCGAISDYNGLGSGKGLTNYINLIAMRGTMQGFIVFDYQARYGEAIQELAKYLAEGSLQRKFHIVEGLQNASTAIQLLFNGGNTGKLVVHVPGSEAGRL